MADSVKIDGVDCYGQVRDNSNFYLVCEDEENDGIWADGNPERADSTFQSWTEVVRVIKARFPDLVEIQEC